VTSAKWTLEGMGILKGAGHGPSKDMEKDIDEGASPKAASISTGVRPSTPNEFPCPQGTGRPWKEIAIQFNISKKKIV